MTSPRTAGTFYGLVAMTAFSITLPVTRIAVLHLNLWVVALGRPVIAGLLAATLMLATRQKLPERRYWKNFAIVTLGVGVGVPLTFAWGMQHLPASHGAITLGLLPLVTALIAAIRAHERPSMRFWIASVVGSGAVVAFALSRGAGKFQIGDIALLISVLSSSIGYVEGARLTRVMPGWQVISWALVLGFPFLLIPFIVAVATHPLQAPPSAWAAFAYLCVVSQFTGLFAWYKGLHLGGISRVGQLQLLQPFGTLLFAALLLGESITPAMLLAAGVVVVSVAIGRNAAIQVHSRTSHEECDI